MYCALPAIRRKIAPAFVVFLLLAPTLHAETRAGIVTDPDGKPVAGALVHTQFFSLSLSPEQKDRQATTGDDGLFRIEAPDPKTGEKPMPWYSLVYKSGWAIQAVMLQPNETTPITLEKGRMISGSVTDKSGKPVANAEVRLRGSYVRGAKASRSSVMIPLALQKRFTSATDAQGNYTIADVPPEGTAILTLDDPRFVRMQQALEGDGAPKPFVARAGATLVGRAVTQDGQPLSGAVAILAYRTENPPDGSQGFDSVPVEKDGTFRITSLPAGRYVVTANLGGKEKEELVATALTDIAAAEGAETKLPDIVFIPGALVVGTVVDATNNQPVANVGVYSNGPHNPKINWFGAGAQVQTDASGMFRLRVAPGSSTLRVTGSPPEYRNPESEQTITLADGETKPLPPVKLERALTVTLNVTDEAGAPVSDIPLLVLPGNWGIGSWEENAPRTDASGVWDSKDSWYSQQLRPGEAIVKTPADWEIVSPEKLTLPADQPIRVVLRKVNVALRGTGRVVTPDGQPVADVYVSISSYAKTADGNRQDSQYESAQTAKDGTFLLPKLAPGRAVTVSASKQDYKFLRGGKVVFADNRYTVGEVVLLPLTGKVTGKVVNAQSQPAPNAWVWSRDGDWSARTRTDANGKFTLTHIPTGEVRVQTAFKDRTASGVTTGKNPLTLSLPASAKPRTAAKQAARDRQMAMKLLAQMTEADPPGKGARTDNYNQDSLANMIARHDIDLALKVGADRGSGTVNDDVLGGILQEAVKTDPDGMAKLFFARLPDVHNPYVPFYRYFDLGMAFAVTRPDFARKCLLGAIDQLGKGVPYDDVNALQNAAALALKLNAPEAETLIARVQTELKEKYPKKEEQESSAIWMIGTLAKGNAERAIQLADTLPPENKGAAYAVIAREIAASQPQLALKLIAQAQTLVGSGNSWQYTVNENVAVVLKSLRPGQIGSTESETALQIARQIPAQNEQQRSTALAWAARLARNPEQRAKVFEEATAISNQDFGRLANLALIATLSEQLNSALSKTLWARFEEAAASPNALMNVNYQMERLAPLIMDRYPALLRVLLSRAEEEVRESARLNADNPNQEDGTYWQARSALRTLALLDTNSALEMADKMNGKKATGLARRDIIELLLTPPGKRADLLKADP